MARSTGLASASNNAVSTATPSRSEALCRKRNLGASYCAMNASFRALCCSVGAMQRASRPSRIAQLMPSAMFKVMRHNSATHADARGSAANWTLRRARAGGYGR
jgi:hypothetical protein